MSLRRSRPLRGALTITAATLLALVTGSAAVSVAAKAPKATARHVVAYYQTQYVTNSNGSQTYVSPLPLGGIATDVEVAALHLDDDGSVHVNDDPPSAAKFTQMWKDVATLQGKGVRVEVMLGGAGGDSYSNLHDNFSKYYALLKNTLTTYHLNGIDLDIEESFSLADTEKLIRQLHTDFGSSFVIAMAPVASDLSGGSEFSGGFSYSTLDKQAGSDINWYNAQFYCGWGDLSSTSDYNAVVANGFSAAKVVGGTVTNSANCGGYVDPTTLASTLKALVKKYPTFAGVAGWEYFNSTPVNGTGPQTWYSAAAKAMS